MRILANAQLPVSLAQPLTAAKFNWRRPPVHSTWDGRRGAGIGEGLGFAPGLPWLPGLDAAGLVARAGPEAIHEFNGWPDT